MTFRILKIISEFLGIKILLFSSSLTLFAQVQATLTLNTKDDGFRGIWYFIGETNNEYVHKYSGGLGTYPANHYPFSVYVKKVNKTFFCYGGASKDAKPSLLHEVAFFDHKNKTVSRPTIVLNKNTNDAHDNPVISVDKNGYIWLFSTSHGVSRSSYIHKSVKPYDIEAFELIKPTFLKDGKQIPFDNFSYLQIFYDKENGFFGFMTHYDIVDLKYSKTKARRTISYITSTDGLSWSELKDIGIIEEGHYQSSGITRLKNGKIKLATAFNYHPNTEIGAGLDYRTNLYYIETTNFGKSWQIGFGETIDLPLSYVENKALVLNAQKENKLTYINDIAFDETGNSMISFISSTGPQPGPENGPYEFKTVFFNGSDWVITKVKDVDHNYDYGSLYFENGKWRLIGPFGNAPYQFNTGGELEIWESAKKNAIWKIKKVLTMNSELNHSYPRKAIDLHSDFYAFWADGHPRKPSASHLYFSNKKGDVFKLPYQFYGNVYKLNFNQ